MATTAIGSSGVTFPNSTTQASASKVLQVVQANTTTSTSISGFTFVTTGIAASITPLFSTSKILIITAAGCYCQTGAQIVSTIYRGATNLASGASGFTWTYAGTTGIGGTHAICYLDSPATTSSTTYTVYAANANIATGTYNNPTGTGTPNTQQATITLMEIAA